MYKYHDTVIRLERLDRGTDHCASDGQVFELSSLVRHGFLRDPRDPRDPGLSLDTHGDSSRPKSTIIFAVNEKHVCHIAFDGLRGQPGAVKHETLFHNGDVLAAGELEVRRGIIVGLNDHSGSYGTYGKLDSDPAFAAAVVRALDLSGVAMVAELDRKLREKSRRHE